MPVSQQFASSQVMRLSGLRDFPTPVPARKELIAALSEVSRDEAHATELVEGILRGRSFAPTPSDLYELAMAEREPEPIDPHRGWKCDGCHDTGWVSWDDDRGIPHARRCACMVTGARK